jgi:hypothetical protein
MDNTRQSPIDEFCERLTTRLTERGFTFNPTGTAKIIREEIDRAPSYERRPYFGNRDGGAASKDRSYIVRELEGESITPCAARILAGELLIESNSVDGGPGYEFCWCVGGDRSVEQVHTFDCRVRADVFRWLESFLAPPEKQEGEA